MDYRMEELVPIVAELAGRFTGKQSSSVTNERARKLMDAVLFTIEETAAEGMNAETAMPERRGRTAWEAYHLGQDLIREKVKYALTRYNEMTVCFSSYSNENYYDTVIKALPGFFLWYDMDFAPQDTIITMDYTALGSIGRKRGIDAVLYYIECICLEQIFLHSLPDGYVEETLKKYDPQYEKGMDNLCEIVLARLMTRVEGNASERLNQILDALGEEALRTQLLEYLAKAIPDIKTRWIPELEIV